MTLRERIGLDLARRLVARLSLAGRVQELEAELRAEQAARRVAERGAQEVGALRQQLYTTQIATSAAERQAAEWEIEAADLRDRLMEDRRLAEDLRKCHHEAEAELEALRRESEERDARHAEVLRVREEELAAALLLPARRSWPDLLDAARRQLNERLVQEIGDATLMAQRDAALRRAAALAEELRQARASLAEQMLLTMAGVPHG